MKLHAHHVIVVVVVAAMVLSGIWLFWPEPEPDRAVPLPIDETVVHCNGTFVCDAWIADNQSLRSQGLIGTEENETRGMLFFFGSTSYRTFHMNGMSYPIDILFLNESKEVVEVFSDFSPGDSPHTSSVPVKYALEMVAGRAALLNITVGSYLDWQD